MSSLYQRSGKKLAVKCLVIRKGCRGIENYLFPILVEERVSLKCRFLANACEQRSGLYHFNFEMVLDAFLFIYFFRFLVVFDARVPKPIPEGQP